MDWALTLTRCGVKPATAARWVPVFDAAALPERFSLGAREMDDWLGQVLHESAMLERIEEGLSYSAQRLMAVWPRRFPTLDVAQAYERNPEALANFVYGGRMGNTQPGDGWRFRGRGLIQVTGRDNYAMLAVRMGLPLLADPDMLLQPRVALDAAIIWWERSVPDAFIGDPLKVRKAVNGGTVGLEDTIRLTGLADGDGDGALS